jgi:hypothetical protein
MRKLVQLEDDGDTPPVMIDEEHSRLPKTAAAFRQGGADLLYQFRDETGALPGIDGNHDRSFVAKWSIRPDVAPERCGNREECYAETALNGDEHVVEAAA